MNTEPEEHLIQFNVRIPLRQRIALDRYLAKLKEKPDPELPDSLAAITRRALQDFIDHHERKAG